MRNLRTRFISRSLRFAALAAVAVVCATGPNVAHAVQQTDPIDYTDPNMAMGSGYVSEASSACIRKSGQTGADVANCMKSYKTESALNELRVAEKKKPVVE